MKMSLERLSARLSEESRLLIAFSGGSDSAFLAAVSHRVLGENMLAVTAVSASLPDEERAAARMLASDLGIPHAEVCTGEFERPEYLRNLADRCFHCKSALFDAFEPIAALAGAKIALGTNIDDLSEHRPGQAAATMRGAVFPLVDAGLTKAEIRSASAELGLRTASKPAAACLSSRVAYGEPVTRDLLKRVEAAESLIRQLGFKEFRVRTHGGGVVARLEVRESEMAEACAQRLIIASLLEKVGFTFGALDLIGFRSGSMNLMLKSNV